MNNFDHATVMFDFKEKHNIYTGYETSWDEFESHKYKLNEKIERFSKSLAFWIDQSEEVQKYEKSSDKELLFKYNYVNKCYDNIRDKIFEQFEFDIHTRRTIVSFANDYRTVRKDFNSLLKPLIS